MTKTEIANFKTILFDPGKTLGQRAARSSFWLMVSQVINRLAGLVRNIILARLLFPEDFGLVGIATIALSLLEVFSQTGFRQALIRKKENIEGYLNTAWTISIIRGVTLFVILFLSAPIIADFFNNPQVTSVVRAMAFTFIILGCQNIATLYFIRELNFKKEITLQLAGALTSLVVSIVLAFILKNVWALVFGSLAGNFVIFLLSYFFQPFRPRLAIKRAYVRELFSFGKYVLASGVLIFAITQGDDALVGRMLGVAALGFYALAYKISNLPATQISHVIGGITLPVYSKFQDNLVKLKELYLKFLQITTFLSFLASGLILVFASDFTKIFLGEKWLAIIPVMQILVFAGLIRSIAATPGKIFYAVKKPEIDTKLQLIRFAVLAILIYPLTVRWGIIGASVAVLASIFVANIGFSFMALRITKCGIKAFAKRIIYPLISASVMVIGVYGLMMFLGQVRLYSFILLALLGIGIYLGMTYILDRIANYGMYSLIKSYFKKLGEQSLE